MTLLRRDLPPITLLAEDVERLDRLAHASAGTFPRVAHFLAREVERANIAPRYQALPGLVRMGSQVDYRDDDSGKVTRITLVYPHESDLAAGKISVLTPVGSALIGLSVSQSIEWQGPDGQWRSLTVLAVTEPPS